MPRWVEPTLGPSRIAIRERPPLRLAVNVETPSGRFAHWGQDDPNGENAPSGLSFSTVMPGGFENMGCTLTRDPARRYPDLEELSKLTVQGVGGKVAWQGRLEGMPETSGDSESVNVSAVGYQSHMDDNRSAREVFIDRDFGNWQDPAIERQRNAILFLPAINVSAGSSGPNALTGPFGGHPALILQQDGAWAVNEQFVEMWYDAHGITIAKLMGVFLTNRNLGWNGRTEADALDKNKWLFTFALADDDVLIPPTPQVTGGGFVDVTSWDGDPTNPEIWNAPSIDGGPPETFRQYDPQNFGTFEIDGTKASRKWGYLGLINGSPYPPAGGDPLGKHGGADGATSGVYLAAVAVVGAHGLPLQGELGVGSDLLPDAPGVLASDVLQYAIKKWTKLAVTSDTVKPSSFVIPHLVFLDPTTVSEMVKETVKYELLDWAVWEQPGPGWGRVLPTFYSNARGARGVKGRKWQARSGPAQLQDAGADVSRLVNGVMVQFTDVQGVSRYVGPTGSGANIEDPSLIDSDPQNPLNEAGVTRWGQLSLGTSTYEAAIRVGQAYLQAQKQELRAGQATLQGHVQDEHGVFWPAWQIRGGDEISFIDATDTSYRRVVHTQWDDSARSNAVQLDAPPDTMQAVLERLSGVLVPFGMS